jgi:hypothetical protein
MSRLGAIRCIPRYNSLVVSGFLFGQVSTRGLRVGLPAVKKKPLVRSNVSLEVNEALWLPRAMFADTSSDGICSSPFRKRGLTGRGEEGVIELCVDRAVCVPGSSFGRDPWLRARNRLSAVERT